MCCKDQELPMNGKYSLTCIGIMDPDIRRWYEAERCWNREPEELQKMLIKKNGSMKTWRTKRL